VDDHSRFCIAAGLVIPSSVVTVREGIPSRMTFMGCR
jgi:hypothetical protein